MKIFDKNFKEIFSAQFFAIIGGLVSGIVLVVYLDKIFIIPGMLIIIPGFMAMRGNISGGLASRVTVGLLLGLISPDRKNDRIVKGNLSASLFLAAIISLLLGLVAFTFNYFVSGIITPKIILVPLLAGIISTFLLDHITLYATIKLFKKGYDPNNMMGPLVTTAGDVTSILSLLIIIFLIV
ncbi:MAG: magnesium transporter [Candidatus Pacearchaeota archaeon]